MATWYMLGVSTRRMDRLVQSFARAKSQVSEMAKGLDAHVENVRPRPLDAGPYTFVAADAFPVGPQGCVNLGDKDAPPPPLDLGSPIGGE